jgi:hypothetical protein
MLTTPDDELLHFWIRLAFQMVQLKYCHKGGLENMRIFTILVSLQVGPIRQYLWCRLCGSSIITVIHGDPRTTPQKGPKWPKAFRVGIYYSLSEII